MTFGLFCRMYDEICIKCIEILCEVYYMTLRVFQTSEGTLEVIKCLKCVITFTLTIIFDYQSSLFEPQTHKTQSIYDTAHKRQCHD